jgi:hypothetical protein
MTIEDFWNVAYLSCLSRLSASEAKEEADKALDLCINHWNSKCYQWAAVPQLWQEQHVGYIHLPAEAPAGVQIYRKPFPDRSKVKIKAK